MHKKNKSIDAQGMALEQVSEILDRQPAITTYVQRTVNEVFGDEGLVTAVNPRYQEAEEICLKLIDESDIDDAPFMTWVIEAERAAYRIGVITTLKLTHREDLLRKVAGHI